MKDERREEDEIHLGEGEVRQQFIGDRPVVPQLGYSHVGQEDRQDNTQVDLDGKPLCVDVVRFAEVGVVQLQDDGSGVVTALNNVIVVQQDEQKVCVLCRHHRQCWVR